MRSTRVHRHINAPRATVYRMLLDSAAIAKWKVPDGMTARVHTFQAHEGGKVRVSLTYISPTSTGKTEAHTDTYHGRFVRLVPNETVVEVDEFETTDPALRGEMISTIILSDAADGGTDVVGVHENLPSGVSTEDNETGWQMALAKLATLTEMLLAREQQLLAVVRDWDLAMIQNDADEIGRFMADDWTLVGSEGTSDKDSFLALVRSGALTHDTMESEDVVIRLYGDAAVVMARGVSGGLFNGRPFRDLERQSNVFIRHDSGWRCVLTHLSRLSPSPGA